MQQVLHFPQLDFWSVRLRGGVVCRVRCPSGAVSGALEPFKARSVEGLLFTPTAEAPLPGPVLLLSRVTASKHLPSFVLIHPLGSLPEGRGDHCRWLRCEKAKINTDLNACEAECQGITASWAGQFAFKAERRSGDLVLENGLRPPQIGALHSALAHWTVTHDPATIVMPTGTGKTETMLALLVAERLRRVFVVVPTDTLRDQLAKKFLTLGVLPAAGVVTAAAQFPAVGILRHKPKTIAQVDEFFRRCNVVVTTAQIAGACTDDVSRRIAELCTHLFVDEAHHVPARTWSRVRSFFAGKPVLQFTATPYRGDGKLVDGKVIYNYPLRKAQDERYFRPIRFRPVEEFSEDLGDERVASTALDQLREDLAAGHDHLLMARCGSIKRAEGVFAIYQRLAPDNRPVLAHSKMKGVEKRAAVEDLRKRQSRVVVCVDMFGEGFDLPELKVAALHDVHKSLAVTLQFTGRFTRTQANVGDATVVANTADADVEEALQALYGEDPDWNYLLREFNEQASGTHVLRSDFLRGFTELPERIPLQNVFPKMSTVVFETKCRTWAPEQAQAVLPNVFDTPALNPRECVLVLVTKEQTPVEWGDVRGIWNTTYDLYVLHWDKDASLLYIHSSDKGTLHERIAKAVCGNDATLIRGEKVFRVLDGLNRLVLTNLGLGHSLSRSVRFTMHVGADIRAGLAEAHAQNKYKTNVFGLGFTGGDRGNVGCSIKGRLWSFRIARDVGEWMGWCHALGLKLQDTRISVEDVFRGAMIPATVTDRPAKVPIAIEWSDDLLLRHEDLVHLELGGLQAPLFEVSLDLVDRQQTGPIRFRVTAERWPQPAEYVVRFGQDRVDYVPAAGGDPTLLIGKRRQPLSEYLQIEAPVILFHDGAFLAYNELLEPHVQSRVPFDSARIEVWDWSDVDLTKESQTQAKFADSIQRRVIEHLLALTGAEAFDVVFDDDASGEAADVVALRLEAERLFVRLYHCKFSKSQEPGARVKDLYEVCGQAQKSVYWKGVPANLIDHLLLREATRKSRGGVSRFERGQAKTLRKIEQQLRKLKIDLEIYVVQPGLSRSGAEAAQLELLAVTELYLKETFGAPFGVIASR
jgi:superfamily II DNA or RNA helicase